MGYPLDQYMAVADLDVSTREGYEGYIRRTIKPALGGMELRKLRGPVLDTFYARLRRCGDLACTGRPFTEHRNVPVLTVDPGDPRPAYRQIADTLAETIRSGQLRTGERLPSVREMSEGGVPTASARHALAVLTEEGLITSRQGRGAFIAAGDVASGSARLRPRRPDHDCAREGCQPHRCKPMSAGTVRQIHAILSGAFVTAVRWEWITRNPAASAKLPKNRRQPAVALSPSQVAKVIAVAQDIHPELATYLWLVAVTGARRGELCGLWWADLDLELGSVHVAHNYLVRGGHRIRKDTKTHQDRRLAIDRVTCDVLAAHRQRAEEAPALDGTSLLEGWTVLATWASGEARSRDQDITAAATKATAARTNLNELTGRLRDDLAAAGIELTPEAAAAGASSAVAGAFERARAATKRVVERRAQAAELISRQQDAQDNQRVARLLGDLLRSDRFPRWLVAEAVDVLVADASANLAALTSDQFDLTYEDGDFYVIDHTDADARRSVRTLSGGETFQASLALALALSSQISELAAAGAARLDSIFLDEGFGTLDPDSLDVVATTLETLAQGQRMVGVVTHVAALAERVPVRFKVSRDARTSRVIREGLTSEAAAI